MKLKTKEEIMEALLEIREGCEELANVLGIVVGTEYAYSYDEGVMGKLSKIEDVIRAMSVLPSSIEEPEMDLSDTEHYKVLEDPSLSLAEKAYKLING